VAEDEPPVDRHDVELDDVGAGGDRRLEGAKRVLGRDRRRAAMSDSQTAPVSA
jgi:hypothetical protein